MREDRVYLTYIREGIAMVALYTKEDAEVFSTDLRTQDAVLPSPPRAIRGGLSATISLRCTYRDGHQGSAAARPVLDLLCQPPYNTSSPVQMQ